MAFLITHFQYEFFVAGILKKLHKSVMVWNYRMCFNLNKAIYRYKKSRKLRFFNTAD